MATPEPGEVNPKKFNHLRKLASSDFGKFALQVEHMSAEVQMKLIAQLPEFRKLASDALDRISRAHKFTLDSMDQGEGQVHRGFEQWRSALLAMLDDPSLSLEDKLKHRRDRANASRASRHQFTEREGQGGHARKIDRSVPSGRWSRCRCHGGREVRDRLGRRWCLTDPS
jgi:hypothetical protein